MESLQRTANRGSISTGYDVDNSVKLDKGNDTTTVEFFERNVSSAGSRTTGTFSAWIKKLDVTTAQYLFTFGNVDNDNGRTFARFQTDGTLRVGGGTTTWLNTNRVFRDTSAWMHIVVAIDTTSGTADNRIRVYVNGVEETSFGTRNNPSQNDVMGTNFGKQAIGYNTIDNNSGFNGYMCEVVIQDGVASAPTEFGEFDSATGIWIPKDASGATMGTNGTYLKFENAASMGAASAGNAFTVQNINQVDQSTDTCTNNFCTLNPNVNFKYTTNGITQGGTLFGENTGGGVGGAFGTFGVSTGKWYWEVKLTDTISHYIGVSADDGDNVLSSSDPHQINSTFNFNIGAARIEYINNGSVTAGSLDAFTDFHSAGDIIGIALNMDDNQISIYGNGTLQSGVANSSLYDAADKTVVPFHGTINDECQYNFGGYSAWTPSSAASDANGYGTFEYAPPSGYYSLCTKNLAEFG